MPRLRLLVTFVALFVAASSAEAAGRESKEIAARRACLNGDPTKGVQILTDLFIATGDPVYIYNQGRCYEQNNRCEDAIARFREYLRKAKGTTQEDKASLVEARKHIVDCEALLGEKPADHAAAPPAPKEPIPAPPLAKAEPATAAVPPQQSAAVVMPPPQPAESPSTGAGLRIAGMTTVAVGAAGLIAGVALNLKANSTVSDLQNRFNPGDYSSSKDYKTASQISYGIGAAFVAGGAILCYLGWTAGNRTTLAPVVAQGAGGAVLTGAF